MREQRALYRIADLITATPLRPAIGLTANLSTLWPVSNAEFGRMLTASIPRMLDYLDTVHS
jgi:hypothetical protein